jgi:hypothetical protein
MADQVEIRTGAYYDSVSLMQVSRSVAAAPGVEAAQVAMATELNLDVIRGMGFDVPDAGPNDMVVAIRGDESGIAAGTAALDEALAGLRSAAAQSAASARRRRHARSAGPSAGRTPTWPSSRCRASTPRPRHSMRSTPA